MRGLTKNTRTRSHPIHGRFPLKNDFDVRGPLGDRPRMRSLTARGRCGNEVANAKPGALLGADLDLCSPRHARSTSWQRQIPGQGREDRDKVQGAQAESPAGRLFFPLDSCCWPRSQYLVHTRAYVVYKQDDRP